MNKSDSENGLQRAIADELAPRLELAKTRQEKTRAAAAVLFFGHGIYPSAKTVLRHTQHGSLTDINRDLREFWDDIREKSRVKIDAPMFPQEILELFSDGLSKIWDLAMDQAHSALDADRQEAAETVLQAQRDAATAEMERQRAHDQSLSSLQELKQERIRREDADRRIAGLSAELDGIRSTLSAAERQITMMMDERRVAEDRHAADMEFERKARQRDTEVFDGEIKFAKMQIEAARSEERAARDQLKAEKSGRELELAALRQRANRAEDAAGATRLELAEIKGRYESLRGQIVELQEKS